MNLSNMSADELEALSKKSAALAADLRKAEPSYALALRAGIRDLGYSTVANGYVSKFAGEAVIELDNGTKWKAIGHGPKGDAYSISRHGFIEFIPLQAV